MSTRSSFIGGLALAGALLAVPSSALAADATLNVTGAMANGYPAASIGMQVTITAPDATQTVKYIRLDKDGKRPIIVPAGSTVKIVASGQTMGANSFDNQYCTGAVQPALVPVFDGAVSAEGASASFAMPQFVAELTAPGHSADEQEFVDRVNAERAANGVAPLTVDTGLSAIADAGATANDIGDGCYAHQGRKGEGPRARMAELGYYGGNDSTGEVVTGVGLRGQTADAVSGFMNSPGHRDILLEPRLAKIGVGRVGPFVMANLTTGAGTQAHPLPMLPRTSPSQFNEQPATTTTTGPNNTGTEPEAGSEPVLIKKTVKVTGRVTVRKGRVTVTGRALGAAAGTKVTLKITGVKRSRTLTVKTRTGGAFTVAALVKLAKGIKAAKRVRVAVTVAETVAAKSASTTLKV